VNFLEYAMLKNNLTVLFLLVLLIFSDQLSKYIIRFSGGFYVCNPDISFGIKLSPTVFWAAWILIITAILYFLVNSERHPGLFGLGYFFILAGAISNIIDRLRLDCVIDFIDLKFWPIFNLADVFIAAGVIMLLITNLKMKSRK